jgi:hypothetical protein
VSTRAPFLSLLLLFVGAPLTVADTITGRVIDENNNPVPNVDIDARGNAGGDITLTNDTTDINGNFTVNMPADIYRLEFRPLSPTHVPGQLDDVVVVGTVNLGDIVLNTAVQVTGKMVDQGLTPVVNVDIDAFDATTGVEIILSGDNTDILGNFSIVVPRDVLLTVDTVNVVGGLFAPTTLNLSLTGNTNLGNVVLEPGFRIDGRVIRPGGAAVSNADLDVENPATEEALFTPRDNTDATGNFSVIVPAGTWDFLLCPPTATGLAAAGVFDRTVGANANLGNIQLPNGFVLSGTIRDAGMNPVPGADVDVNASGTGISAVLCGDNADLSGFYSVLVPAGTWDIRFSTSTAFDLHTNVAVNSNSTLNGSLTPCSQASVSTSNGSGVNPFILTNLTAPRIGTTWSVGVNCAGHAPSLCLIYLYGASTQGLVLKVGELLVTGPRFQKRSLSHSGNTVGFNNMIPPDLSFCGLPFFTQALVLGSPGGQLSNRLDCVVGQ